MARMNALGLLVCYTVVCGFVATLATGTAYAVAGLDRAAVKRTEGNSPIEETPAQSEAPTFRTWQVTARRYRFEPARIEVFQGDLVRVELHTEDIAHSLVIGAYRIAKRVGPGQPVTFEFRADRAGTFPFYCSLQIEDGCRQMHGDLVVKPRP